MVEPSPTPDPVQEREFAVESVLTLFRAGERDLLRLALHPYLHWTTPEGGTIRGRTKVLELLDGRAELDAPESAELRDGQVYRWRELPQEG
ncbi:hypothetical protein [Dermatobacter hominis]|uniref:hypothetical protein n=1 Tax=Dermatobacter hominis TaxID=2884263 RepID=UPI001D12B474|nr:hypothetical protein [Dermatobacter hominis]UDY34890.1 hypothetical protein LH044_16310 [Dermatobacter hominis]